MMNKTKLISPSLAKDYNLFLYGSKDYTVGPTTPNSMAETLTQRQNNNQKNLDKLCI